MTAESKSRTRGSVSRGLLGGFLLLGSALLVSSAHAQVAPVVLQAPPAYNGDPNTVPLGATVGDFNGDGYLDFAVAEQNSSQPGQDKIAIYLGNSDGSFTKQGAIPVNGSIAGVAFAANHIISAGRFNGTGQPVGIAVAVTSSTLCGSGPGVLFVYLQGPAESTSVCQSTTAAPASVAVADFNNDGFDDFAVSNPSGSTSGTLSVYLNKANITTAPAEFSGFGNVSVTSINVTGTLYGILVAGNLANPSGLPGGMALLASTGPFTQYVAAILPANVSNGPGSTIFEFNWTQAVSTGSGFSDFLIAPLQGVNTAAIVGIGSNGMSYLPVTYGLISAIPTLGPLTGLSGSLASSGLGLASADLDGNSVPDFTFFNENHNLGIILNPTFANPPVIGPFGPAADAIAIGLSTGLNQWVVVDAGGLQQDVSGFNTATNSTSLTQVAEGRWVIPYLASPTTGFPSLAPVFEPTTTSSGILPAFAVGDFNGDGLPDVAVLGLNQANLAATVVPFLNVSTSAASPLFQAQPVFDLGAGSSISTPGVTGFSLVAGSFRHIDPDIAIVTSDGVTLLENQGVNGNGQLTFALDPDCQGSFNATGNCYLGGNPNFPGLPGDETTKPPILAADVNGDGFADIVVAVPENCNVFNGAPHSAIFVLISNGDGTFQPPVYVPSPVANPVGLAFGELLGSGFNDLVVVNGGEQCSDPQAGVNPLVGAALLPNNHDGTGSFGSPVPIFSTPTAVSAPWVSSAAIGDMNLDGTPDVVLSANDGIHVLLNSHTNPGTFADQGAVPLYSGDTSNTNAAQIDIADVNQDGFPDVVAAIGGVIYVFAGDGLGQVAPPVQGFASGPNSTQVKAAAITLGAAPGVFVSNTEGFSVVPNNSAVLGTPLAQFETSTNLNFGGVVPGSSQTMQVILENSGTASLLITNIAFANNTGSLFSFNLLFCTAGAAIASSTQISIASGASCTFNVTFTPNAVGPTAAQLLFLDNAPNSNAPDQPATGGTGFAQSIGLAGSGIASQANTSIVVTNSPLSVSVGALVQYTVTLSNPGPSPATNVVFSHQLEPSVTLGTIPSDCSVANVGTITSVTCNLGTLAVGASTSFNFAVTPTAVATLANPFLFTQSETDGNPQSTSDSISVSPNVLVSFTISPSSASVAPGSMQQFSAMGMFSNGIAGDATSLVTWSASPSSVATISNTPGSQGLATAIAPGMATITASFGVLSTTATLTVSLTDNEPITVNDQVFVAALVPISDAVADYSFSKIYFGGQSTQLLAISNLGQQNLTFTSATISGAGFSIGPISCSTSSTSLTTAPLGPGAECYVTITYTSGGAPTGTITFTDNTPLSNVPSTQPSAGVYAQTINLSASTGTNTVPPATAVSLMVTPASPTVPQGATQQFAATGTFSDGSTSNMTTQVTWSASPTSPQTVATISNVTGSQGLANAASPGTATITATFGLLSASASMIVPISITEVISVDDTVGLQVSGGTPPNLTGTTTEIKSTAAVLDGVALPTNTDLVGNPVTVDFAVSPISGGGTPTGTIVVSDSAGDTCNSTALRTGASSCQLTISQLGTGSASLTATYVPDANSSTVFSGSTSSALNEKLAQIVACANPIPPQTVNQGGTVMMSFDVCLAGDVHAAPTVVVTGCPQDATCTATTSPAMGQPGVYVVAVKVVTIAADGTSILARPRNYPQHPERVSWFAELLALLMAVFFLRHRFARPRLLYAATLLLAAALCGFSGCTSASLTNAPPPPIPTPAGNFTLTVTITAGSAALNVPIQLTVNP